LQIQKGIEEKLKEEHIIFGRMLEKNAFFEKDILICENTTEDKYENQNDIILKNSPTINYPFQTLF
jgi:hypothetical protein